MSEPIVKNDDNIKMEEASEEPSSNVVTNNDETKETNVSDKAAFKLEQGNDIPKPPEADTNDEPASVAAMAVAAPDEEIEASEPVKTETMPGEKTESAENPKEEEQKDENPASTGSAADAAQEGAIETTDKPPQEGKNEEGQSVEDAAAEAGLAVVIANDTGVDDAPPLGPPGVAQPGVVPPPEESPYPYQVNAGKDVISGKGGKVQQYNRHFRNLVAENYPAYDSTTSKIAKRRIGVSIYNTVVERGGRFLDAQGKEMDRSKAVLKVMKALKDAKTWTSDAKRAAKERREAKQKEGGEKGEKEQKAEPIVESNANPPAPATPEPSPEAAPIPAPPEILPAPPAPEEKDGDDADEPKKTEEEEKSPESELDAKDQEEEKEDEKEGKEDDKEEKEDDKAAKVDKQRAGKAEKEKDSPAANTRPRRTSKRRVQLPLSGTPPAKVAKKGSEDIVDSTNDAVRGLHLLSQATQAVAKDGKGSRVERV